MSRHADISYQRKNARPLYLELRALGLEMWIEKDADDLTGYRIVVECPGSISPAHVEQLARRARGNKVGLIKVLLSRSDPDLHAVRTEGVT